MIIFRTGKYRLYQYLYPVNQLFLASYTKVRVTDFVWNMLNIALAQSCVLLQLNGLDSINHD